MIPEVSIIMCAYNAGRYIVEAIDSVQAQTFENWELIVVDDGSVDDTAQKVKTKMQDQRIRYIYQENAKQGKARNNGIAHATAEWIAILDADDRWMPEKMQLQLALANETNADVMCSRVNLIDAEGNYVADNRLHTLQTGLLSPQQAMLNGRNDIIFSTVLMKKEVIDSVGGFNETPGMAEDYQLFLTLTDRGYTFYRQPEILADYRIHASQTSSTEFVTFMLSVRAYRLVDFKNIPRKQTRLAMKKRLNRFLLHNIDTLSAEQRGEILRFYAEFPGLKIHAMMQQCMLLPGESFYKKWAYACLDLL
jgi:glycosyltransferase involved in cell wall biosynthesis